MQVLYLHILKTLQTQMELSLEANRKATFKSWVFNDKVNCNAAKLAEAGFIFTGSKQEPDAVKCFLCNKSLDSWDAEDDPWTEHQKHSPNCSFAKKEKPEKAFTLTEYLDIRNELIESTFRNMIDDNLDKFNHELDEIVLLAKILK